MDGEGRAGVPKSRTRLSDFTSSTEQTLTSENRAVWFWLSKIRKARLALLEHIQISERLLWVWLGLPGVSMVKNLRAMEETGIGPMGPLKSSGNSQSIWLNVSKVEF